MGECLPCVGECFPLPLPSKNDEADVGDSNEPSDTDGLAHDRDDDEDDDDEDEDVG